MAESTKRGAPSIHDVAQHAGVSPATVSRVLNNTAHVAPAKAELVRQAVEHLGFRPSSVARALSLGRTGTIGVIAPSRGCAGSPTAPPRRDTS
jgi:LacI family transcriptional regulator